MSVYKKATSPYWQYDFQYEGRRFHGSTGQTTEAKARTVEGKKRYEVANGDFDRAFLIEQVPTLDVAIQEYWTAHDLDKADDPEHLRKVYSFIIEIIGPDKKVNKVSSADVSNLVEARAKIPHQYTGKPLAPGTINRETVNALRPVLKRQRLLLNSDPEHLILFPEIAWGSLARKVAPTQPVRYKREEVTSILDTLKPAVRSFAIFQMRYALRISEMFFPLTDIDLDEWTIAIRGGLRRDGRRLRKNERSHMITIVEGDRAWIKEHYERAKAAGLDTLWTVERRRARGKPKLERLTYRAAADSISRVLDKLGLKEAKGVRGSHSFRHHGAMAILKATGNMRLTQKALGHASINSTQIYAHVDTDDLREGMEAVAAMDSAGKSHNSPDLLHTTPKKIKEVI